MTALSYDSRMRTITGALNEFLRQFKTPPQLDEKAALTRLRMTAETINKRLPASLQSEGLANRLGDIFAAVFEDHRGREWPSGEQFASAADAIGKRTDNVIQFTPFDPIRINLRRIEQGEALGHEWIYGRLAVELIQAGATEAQLDAYRSALFFHFKDQWGEGPARDREQELRHRHDEALEAAGLPRRYQVSNPYWEAAE